MLRTKTQLAGNGDQVADGLQAILIGNGLGYCDAVGIVDAQLIEHIHTVLLHNLCLGIFIEGLALRYIAGVLLEEGGEDSAVIGVHNIAAGIFPGELPEHIHSRHLVLDGYFHIAFVSHNQFHHLVDQLHFRVDAVVEGDLRAGIPGTASEDTGHQHGRECKGKNFFHAQEPPFFCFYLL